MNFTSEEESMQSITNPKENAWEEMKEPITSRHGGAYWRETCWRKLWRSSTSGIIKTSHCLRSPPTQEYFFIP